jgi:asparagine synthase (glutamine-hydrolysing)
VCGICGIINVNDNPVSTVSISEMMKTMKHRGPDDEGIFIDDNIGLGFVRLSILDLSPAGHQPMKSSDGNYVLIFNGEIYNYIELRNELKSKGYTFKSDSDSEVLLNAYIEWGDDVLNRLNGMFAFVIYNKVKKEIFGARDRFGIKPFYYINTGNQFIFASEIPSILSVCESRPKPNDKIIYDYLTYNRTNHTNETFFEDVLKLPHGQCVSITNGYVSTKKWYNLNDRVKKTEPKSFNEKDFLQEFSKSINLQLRSDVEVGTCLSGGLDSSAITSIVLKNNTKALHSFSAIYDLGDSGDETPFINIYSDTSLRMHFTKPAADGLLQDIYNLHLAISEPIPNTSEYAEYKVMELAKKNCTVILNGQGADEMMAGYHYFYGYYFKELLLSFKLAKLVKEIYFYLSIHRSLFGLKSFLFSLNPRLYSKLKRNYLKSDFKNRFSDKKNPILDDFYNAKTLQEFLIKHFEYKFEHHLLWADKSGMHFSLETRFPFLDHNLVEKTLASGITIKNGWTKHLLRESMNGILPEKIRLRVDKMGFETPENRWFQTQEMKTFVEKILSTDKFKARPYFDNTKVDKVLNEYLNQNNYNPDIWKWLSLEIWFNLYID